MLTTHGQRMGNADVSCAFIAATCVATISLHRGADVAVALSSCGGQVTWLWLGSSMVKLVRKVVQQIHTSPRVFKI
jgi:hypothetical protein